jgi:hypothetical protein
VRDGFLPRNAGSTTVEFVDGRPRVVDDGLHDVELTVDVSELSSLVMGTASAERLHMYGLAEVSDIGYLGKLERLFAVPHPPQCLTQF